MGPLAVRIRRARQSDAVSIASIYNREVRTSTATFDTTPRTEADQAERLTAHGARLPVLVAVHERRVVGWASLTPWSPRGAYRFTAESSVYVRTGWRRRGVGRALVQALIASARAARLRVLLARIADDRTASLGLHRELGFRRIGTMHDVGRKFDRWVDVTLLERPIEQRPTRHRPAAGRSGPATAWGLKRTDAGRTRRRRHRAR